MVAVLRYEQIRAPATGEPLLYRGFVTATVAPGTPEPDEGYHEVTPVARASNAAAWHYEAAARCRRPPAHARRPTSPLPPRRATTAGSAPRPALRPHTADPS